MPDHNLTFNESLGRRSVAAGLLQQCGDYGARSDLQKRP